jgi:hypothetical protein
MIDGNWVESGPGRARGWTETTLPGSMRTLVLMLRRDQTGTPARNDALAGAVLSVMRPTTGPATYSTLRPQELLLQGEQAYLCFTLPGPYDGALHALVRTAAGWRQDGLLGFADELATLLSGATAIRPDPVIAGTADTYRQATKVVIR